MRPISSDVADKIRINAEKGVQAWMLSSSMEIARKWRNASEEGRRTSLAKAIYERMPRDEECIKNMLCMPPEEWRQLWLEMAQSDLEVFRSEAEGLCRRQDAARRLIDCVELGLPVQIPEITPEIWEQIRAHCTLAA